MIFVLKTQGIMKRIVRNDMHTPTLTSQCRQFFCFLFFFLQVVSHEKEGNQLQFKTNVTGRGWRGEGGSNLQISLCMERFRANSESHSAV